jgi:hypothetical protein
MVAGICRIDKLSEAGMINYRAYLIGRNGRIQGYEPLTCADDAAAIAAAKRLIGSHGVEVWQDDRRVITLERAQTARVNGYAHIRR